MGLSTNVLRQIAAGTVRLEAIAEALGVGHKAVNKAAQVLKKREFITVRAQGDGFRLGIYELTPAGRAWAESGREVMPGQGERPRQRTVGLRERAWWHFRAHRLATLKELLTTHADGTEKAADNNLYKWLAALEKVGILQRSARRLPARQSRGQVQWKLAKDLGPKAPVWRQVAREIFDPNGGKIFPMPEEGGHE
ncbi:MAG: hypothetical protein ACM3VY_00515 [Candidatus Bathyarchaeota archaeon]